MSGYTIGDGGQIGGSIDPEDQDRNEAYKKGRNRHHQYEKDPSLAGGPKDDGYASMTQTEKDAYKQGHRGE